MIEFQGTCQCRNILPRWSNGHWPGLVDQTGRPLFQFSFSFSLSFAPLYTRILRLTQFLEDFLDFHRASSLGSPSWQTDFLLWWDARLAVADGSFRMAWRWKNDPDRSMPESVCALQQFNWVGSHLDAMRARQMRMHVLKHVSLLRHIIMYLSRASISTELGSSCTGKTRVCLANFCLGVYKEVCLQMMWNLSSPFSQPVPLILISPSCAIDTSSVRVPDDNTHFCEKSVVVGHSCNFAPPNTNSLPREKWILPLYSVWEGALCTTEFVNDLEHLSWCHAPQSDTEDSCCFLQDIRRWTVITQTSEADDVHIQILQRTLLRGSTRTSWSDYRYA